MVIVATVATTMIVVTTTAIASIITRSTAVTEACMASDRQIKNRSPMAAIFFAPQTTNCSSDPRNAGGIATGRFDARSTNT
ncbi:hypothetical protein D3C87_2036350 [compost metagenome]